MWSYSTTHICNARQSCFYRDVHWRLTTLRYVRQVEHTGFRNIVFYVSCALTSLVCPTFHNTTGGIPYISYCYWNWSWLWPIFWTRPFQLIMYVTILDFWKALFLLLAYHLCKSPSSFKRRLAWWQIVVRQCVWSSGQNSTLSGRGKVVAIILSANLQTVSLLFATICYLLGDNRVWLPTVRTGAGRRSGQTLTLFRCIVWHIAIYSHWRSCCLAYCNVLSLAILLSGILQCILTGDPARLNGFSWCWLAN